MSLARDLSWIMVELHEIPVKRMRTSKIFTAP